MAVGDPGFLLLHNYGGEAPGTLIARIPAPGNYFRGERPFHVRSPRSQVDEGTLVHPTSLLRPMSGSFGTGTGPLDPCASRQWEGPHLCPDTLDPHGWPIHPWFGSVVLGYCDEEGNGPFSTNPYLQDPLLGVVQPPIPL